MKQRRYASQRFGGHCSEIVSNAGVRSISFATFFQSIRHLTTNVDEVFRRFSIRYEQTAHLILNIRDVCFHLVHRLRDIVQGCFQFERFYRNSKDKAR